MFQPGHPQVGESYGRHPFVDKAYIPLGGFHRHLREAKHSELTQLLVALGATRLRVRVAQDAAHSGEAAAAVSLPGFAVRGKVAAEQHHAHDVLFEETYRPRLPPYQPQGLFWLDQEPSWRGLVDRRLQHGTQHAVARLEYVDEFDVTAELGAKVEKLGGKISGGFRSIERIVWDFEVWFV